MTPAAVMRLWQAPDWAHLYAQDDTSKHPPRQSQPGWDPAPALHHMWTRLHCSSHDACNGIVSAHHGRAVQGGDLPPALNLYASIVHAAALQRRQQRLHRVNAAHATLVRDPPSHLPLSFLALCCGLSLPRLGSHDACSHICLPLMGTSLLVPTQAGNLH